MPGDSTKARSDGTNVFTIDRRRMDVIRSLITLVVVIGTMLGGIYAIWAKIETAAPMSAVQNNAQGIQDNRSAIKRWDQQAAKLEGRLEAQQSALSALSIQQAGARAEQRAIAEDVREIKTTLRELAKGK